MTPSIEAILAIPAALDQRVEADRIDQNGHMNIAHYFHDCTLAPWHLLTEEVTGPDYIERRGLSFFTVEHRIGYLGELREGERYSVHPLVVGRTDKAAHLLCLMVDRERDRLACRTELMYVHVDMAARRATAMPDDVATALDALAGQHREVGRSATGLSLRRSS